ncbi:MAG: MFS transporter [Micromonosporaceae bacterium]|nr:MFS transporter [Micromonosporaceae bacterium]
MGRGTPRAVRWLRGIAVDVTPLRHAAFRRLWIGHGVSFIGYQLTAVAIPVQMYQITRSSFWVGLLGIAALVPLLVFALWGGAIADAMDRRVLLLVSSLVVWAATLALMVQAFVGVRSPGLLLGLIAVQSVGFAVGAPTRSAIVPRLVPAGLVPAANTLNFTMASLSSVLGPLLAGVVIARWGFAAAYAVDAVLFTVALWAAFGLPALRPLVSGAGAAGRGLRAVVDGLRFIASAPVLWLSFVVDIVAMALAMPRALFPEVAATRFGDEALAGWLFAAIALGSVVGGVCSGWVGRVRRQGLALVLAVVFWGLAVAAAWFAPSLWLMVVLLAVAGFADLVSAVYRQTIVQLYAPDELRGRLQGVFTAVVAGGPRLGDLRAGTMAVAVGPGIAWAGGGIACAVVAVALALAFPALSRYRPKTA